MTNANLSEDGTHGRAPSGTSPSLVLRLRDGWRTDPKGRHLVSPDGETVEWGDVLPDGSTIVATVPELAEAPPESLGPDDRNLAHYAHVILPADSDGAEYLAIVEGLEAVERAELPPQISLPTTPGASGGGPPPGPPDLVR